jgi:hypothetical protein
MTNQDLSIRNDARVFFLFADRSLLYFHKKILRIYSGEIRIKHYI